MKIFRTLTIATTLTIAPMVVAADWTDYLPTPDGVIMARYEQLLIDDTPSRFQVRYARLGLYGKIIPEIDYRVQADFCDEGKFKMLDAWARYAPVQNVKVKIGQFRAPFGCDVFRGPGVQVFSNRSFVARDVVNQRAVGASVLLSATGLPLTIEAGVFNPNSISDHTPYSTSKVAACKATYSVGDFSFTSSFKSYVPQQVRINTANCSATLRMGRWMAEAEYTYKHFCGSDFKDSHAYNFMSQYLMPVKWGVFNYFSMEGRYDGHSFDSSGACDGNGLIVGDLPARSRLTVGSTVSYRMKNLRCDFRLNYENYFYRHGYEPLEGRDDKIVAEMVIKF